MTNEIVPFGKYKGRPVEDVAADPQYSSWLMEQQWFRERFAALYATIAALHQPAETPEHNAMQAKFLSDEWCEKLVGTVGVELVQDATLRGGKWVETSDYKFIKISKARFEERGADVEIQLGHADKSRLRIELKPTMGDDFPAVLRQVKASECNVVVVGYFQAEGATLEQVEDIFRRSGVELILQSEIDDWKRLE